MRVAQVPLIGRTREAEGEKKRLAHDDDHDDDDDADDDDDERKTNYSNMR